MSLNPEDEEEKPDYPLAVIKGLTISLVIVAVFLIM
jgi:hypothetical protein